MTANNESKQQKTVISYWSRFMFLSLSVCANVAVPSSISLHKYNLFSYRYCFFCKKLKEPEARGQKQVEKKK